MIDCNVAFTGVDSTENPYPGLSVLRAIKESGEFLGKIIVFTYDSVTTGLYKYDLIDEVYQIPFPSEPENYLFPRIEDIHRQTKIDVLIPCLDSEIATYARLADKLRNIGIKTFVPPEAAVKARSKAFLREFCEKNQFDHPKSYVINDPQEIDQHSVELHYPLLIKGSIIDAQKVYYRDEAQVFFHRFSYQWGLPLIVQECVDGDEYDIALVADQNSDIVAKVVMKKIGITNSGKAFAGVTVDGEEFHELASKVVKALQWQGPMELEIIKNPYFNKKFIIEINARLPAWIYTTMSSNLNLPLLTLKLALGERVEPQLEYKKGVMFSRVFEDIFCDFNHLVQLNLQGSLNWRSIQLSSNEQTPL